MTSALPGHDPKACHTGYPHTHDLCSSGHTPRSAQACTISTPLGYTPQVCTGLHDLHSTGPCPKGLPSCEPQTFTISTRPCPQTCTDIHNLHWAVPLTPAQACMISIGTMPLKPTKQAIHRHSGSPLCWPVPFRHTRPTLQRPASLLPKASTFRLVGPHPPATCHRRVPNLLKKHTQAGLDAKGVTSQHLRLQFYCSRTGDFFFFPFFKGFSTQFAV
jgi:hypothetical protein